MIEPDTVEEERVVEFLSGGIAAQNGPEPPIAWSQEASPCAA